MQHAERERQALEVRFRAEAEDRVRETEEGRDHEARKMAARVRELEKSIEAMRVNADERMNLALDAKDKEVAKANERIQYITAEH